MNDLKNTSELTGKSSIIDTNRSVFSISGILISLLLIPLTNLFPLHGPSTRTWLPVLPDWARPLLLFPSDKLVTDPLIRLTAALAVGTVILYLILDLKAQTSSAPATYRPREILVWLLIGLFVIVPLIGTMAKRYHSEQSVYNHDGGIYQTTEAIEMILDGRNPYTHDYQNLYMRAYAEQSGVIEPMFHNPYLPGSFLLPIPVYFISNAMFGMHFQRLFYLICFIGLLLLVRTMATGEKRLAMLVAVGLNPAVGYFLHQGRNDIALAVLLLATVWCVDKRWPVLAGVFYGCACGYKQLAWFAAPFLWIYLQGMPGDRKKNSIKTVIAATVVFLVLMGPFVIWDAGALYDDTFAFNSGSSEHPYKLGGTPGFGAANLVLYWGAVESRASYFPFWIPMLLAGVPLMIWLGKLQLKNNNRSMLMASITLITFVIPYFSRFFHDNYFALISILIAVSVFTGDDRYEGTTGIQQ